MPTTPKSTMKPLTFFAHALVPMVVLLATLGLHAPVARADDLRQGVALYEEEDYVAAAAAFTKAAEKGNADAQFNLGLMYLKGQGVAQDNAQALKWFRQSAGQGNPKAQVNLGRMYARAKAVAPNFGLAASWYRKAADQGYADGQYDLGVLYLSGVGVERSYQKAWRLFLDAAEQSNDSACYQLGLMYLKGLGVAKNKVEGLKFLILARDYGEAALYLKYAGKGASQGQIEEAQKMATEWRQVHPAREP
jgi:hypothetical protein